jgi:uroporphyrinogen-III decarboxylase
MNSRERVLEAINHREPDRVPIDIGGSIVSGIMAGALARLREHLGMDGRPVEVYDVFQMLGRVTEDLVERFKIDLLPVEPEAITFGHLRNRDYKPWTLFDGTEVLVPGNFEIEVSPEGSWLLHEQGDPSKPVIARMPVNGFYFDMPSTTDWDPHYTPPDLETLRNSDWRRLTYERLEYLQQRARLLRSTTDKALVLTDWGDLDSGAPLGSPSVGSLPEWLVLLASEPNYVRELMDLGTEVSLDNLKLYWAALGGSIDIIHLDGYDFGAQNREMFSPAMFEEYYEPCYTAQCDWIHENTPWKTAKHCCGSIPNLMEPMIRAGIDILNPVQTSAGGMDPEWLKETFGDRLTFWGGGVDTQRVLPFGTPDEVYDHVVDRVRVLAPGGGFIWAGVHNIQSTVPPENILAAIEAVHDVGTYPIG